MRRGIPRLKSLRIRQQILVLCVCSVFIPLFIIGLYSILQARRQLSDRYHAQIADAALRINSTIFDITTSLYSSCENLAKASYLSSLLGADEPVSAEDALFRQAEDTLSTLRVTTAAVSAIHIYTDNPNLPTGAHIIPVENYDAMPWLLTTENKFLGDWQCLPVADSWGNPVYELTLIRQLAPSSARYTAFLVVSVDHNYMKNRMLDSDYLVMASVDNTPAFYASESGWVQKYIPFPEGTLEDYYSYTGQLFIDGTKQLANIITFLPYRTSNRFYICVADKHFYENIDRITSAYVFILIMVTILPLFSVFVFSAAFDKRLQLLKEVMHQVRMGDYNVSRFFGGDDELNEIYSDLTATVKKIEEDEARFYQGQLDRQKLINRQQEIEFKMLSNQINPHFLYNTLETIRMQALAAGCRDVVSSIKLLGQSMHYVLENTGNDSTTLEKELAYTETYLSIQKLRFGNRINWQISCPEGFHASEYKILPLLIQPIVENAVVHGLECRKEEGMIYITLEEEPSGLLMIRVADNGKGMTAPELTELNARLSAVASDSGSSIGLYNISQRIRLLYGIESGITISERQGGGTEVLLKIPVRRNEEG